MFINLKEFVRATSKLEALSCRPQGCVRQNRILQFAKAFNERAGPRGANQF